MDWDWILNTLNWDLVKEVISYIDEYEPFSEDGMFDDLLD